MKKQKNYQIGAISPIYLRITIDGTRSEVTTGRSIDPLQWNPRLGRAQSYKESIKSFNFYLDYLQVKIHEAHSQLTKENQNHRSDATRQISWQI